MRVSRIYQYSPTPINAFERLGHIHPLRGKNHNIALCCVLLGPREGARTKFRDEFAQRFRTSGVGYDDRATGIYQMAADCGRYISRPDKSYFHG
jgi:hypothetical protein